MMPEFIFVSCQVGAEGAFKAEMARDWPDLRFAFSRPGFLTFKLPKHHRLTDACDLHAVFARRSGFSLGKTSVAKIETRAAQTWRLAADLKVDRLHVWQRERMRVADRDPDRPRNYLSLDSQQALLAAAPGGGAEQLSAPTEIGQLALDCVVVEPGEWWIGYHRAYDAPSCWPGGVFPLEPPAGTVSRAYLKMEEALAWSGLPIAKGDVCAEIGSAPGGASQALLGHGLKVIGIDPAEMDPRVLAHPDFTHVRKRGADVRRREFRNVRWLTADVNVAPAYTLDTVEAIVTHPMVRVRGLLLTLKLLDWSLAEQIPEYLARVRSWGYNHVAARQLSHNRQEICVAALRRHR